jgi:hypothetical protein
MRSTFLIAAALFAGLVGLAVLWLAVPGLAAAADPCAWKDPGKIPRLFLQDRVAIFRYPYDAGWAACAASKGDEVQVQWRAGDDAGAPPLRTDKLTLDRSPGDGPRRLQARLYPNHVCDGRAKPARGKLVVSGLPGEERVNELVPLRASVVAAGRLSPLAYTSPPLEFPCPACGDRGRQMLRVRDDREGNPSLEGELDVAWFDCAKHGATLALLGFSGATEEDVRRAIRPELALEGLEKAFVRKGDKYVLQQPLPKSRLCARKANVWSFEFWGRGELMAAAGGGRSLHSIRCQ